MSAFFDTNVLIYAQEHDPKSDTARDLLAAGGFISVQVLNEFTSVSVRKFGRSWEEVAFAIDDLLALLDGPTPLTVETHVAARALAEAHKLSFFDALIVASALESGCSILYSEDLQNGRAFGELRIVNPFLD